jgi:uncharacterized membrane protein YqaE (UPF0057 family)
LQPPFVVPMGVFLGKGICTKTADQNLRSGDG